MLSSAGCSSESRACRGALRRAGERRGSLIARFSLLFGAVTARVSRLFGAFIPRFRLLFGLLGLPVLFFVVHLLIGHLNPFLE